MILLANTYCTLSIILLAQVPFLLQHVIRAPANFSVHKRAMPRRHTDDSEHRAKRKKSRHDASSPRDTAEQEDPLTPSSEYRRMLDRFAALIDAPTCQPRPTMQQCQVKPWLGKLYDILHDKYDLEQYLDVENHGAITPDSTAWSENDWVQIPLRGVRPARPNWQGAGQHRILFYGVNSWKWIVPILQAGFLKPSELPKRNAGDKSCPKLFGGFSVGIAEKYACPHMFDGKWLQVMFVVSMLHAVKHPKKFKAR